MESGYKIKWTDHALYELQKTYNYLINNFSDKELNKLSNEIDLILKLVIKNPTLFPLSGKNDTRRIVILKYNSLYYRINEKAIEVVSFFSNRQGEAKLKL